MANRYGNGSLLLSGGEDARPPLHFAALNSSTGAVDALLTGGAPAGSVATASGLPPLHYAVSNPDAGVAARPARRRRGRWTRPRARRCQGRAHAAAARRLARQLQRRWFDLLTARRDIHPRGQQTTRVALILAASNGHSAVINKTAQRRRRREPGASRSPPPARQSFCGLGKGGGRGQVTAVVKHIPATLLEDSCGGTAVEWAALEGQLDAVRTLATHGADLTHKDFNGRTALILRRPAGRPLWTAPPPGHDNVVAELLRWDGAHLASMTDMDGRTALHWAAVQGHQQVVRQLAAVTRRGGDLDAAGRREPVADDARRAVRTAGDALASSAWRPQLDPSISASASVTSSPQCSVVDDSELAWMSGLQSGEAARGFRTPRAYGVDPVPPTPLTASSTVSKTPLVPLPPSAAAGSARLSQTFLKPLAPGSSHRSPARRGLALPAMGSPQAAESSKNIGTPAVQEIMVDLRHASVFPGSPVRGAQQGITELVDGSSPGPPRTCASPQAEPRRAAPRPAATGQRASGLLQPGFSFVGPHAELAVPNLSVVAAKRAVSASPVAAHARRSLAAPAMRRSDNAAGGRQQYGKRLSKSMATPMERHGLAADDDGSLRPAYNRSQLVQAAADGLLSKVVAQLAQGAAVDARDSQGSTALLLACCGGHLQVVETLLAHSAQVDAANDAGRHA
eukprot:jgi/Tetstr1/461720/TSEL_006810.t1